MKTVGIKGKTIKALAVFGLVAFAMGGAAYGEDPYIESTGTSGISTGYRMNGSSRVEVDFALTETSSSATYYIFGSNGGGYEPSLATAMFFDATHFKFTVGPAGQYTAYHLGVDTDRHTTIIDLPEDQIVFMTGGVTNAFTNGRLVTSSGLDFTGKEATLPLSLFARFYNSTATKFANTSKVRIYGVKIYENGVLVRNFTPCRREGVACFKDLVGGGFIVGENVAAFTAGGDNVPTYLDDGYVSTKANENGGLLYLDTGYIVTRKTAVALDCALTENCEPTTSISMNGYLFCSYPRFGFNFMKYVNPDNRGLRYDNRFGGFDNNSGNFSAAFPEPVDDKDVRRTFFIDNYNCVAGVVTSGFTNQTVTCESSSGASSSDVTLKLSGYFNDTQLLHAPLKIYGCKIWEEGVLVKDFVPYVTNGVPGLRDSVSGSFITVSRYSSDTTSTLAYGGVIKGEQDAYLESNGTTGLNTGYKMNGNSRLEVDFAATEIVSGARIFGSHGGGYESTLSTTFFINDATYFYFQVGKDGNAPSKYHKGVDNKGVDTGRHTAIIDLPRDQIMFMTGNATNAFSNGKLVESTGLDFTGKEATLPLTLFARLYGSSYANMSKARIYSVRIYESGALAHEFLPYGGGAVTGLYDTVTGDVISNGPSFTFGGAGYDHGSLKARIKSGYPAKLAHRGTTTLTAYAPGANSYKWLMDGQPISGGTDGVLSVEWARGGTKTDDGYVHTYQAIAVYDNFYGVARDGEPSDAATITSELLGMTIVVK